METDFRVGNIRATSQVTDEPNELDLQDYDVVIVGSSWDTRCLWLLQQSKLHATTGILITYREEDPFGRQKQHNERLRNYLRSTCKFVHEVKGNSHEINAMWREVASHLSNAVDKNRRPLRLCCDITAIPRYCTLAVLAGAITSGQSDLITFVYAEGDYDAPLNKNDAVVFHEGDWQAAPVPFFEGSYDPLKGRHYIVSLGFEGRSTRRVVMDGEPDRVSVLVPYPGVKPEYATRALFQNKALIDDYCVPENEILSAMAGDAVAAWKVLHMASIDCTASENVFYLCCGTKPHSLAIALRALTQAESIVLYYIAESHTVTDVKPNGKYWRYDICDLSLS